MTIQTMTLGYARLGKRRELKKALESFWGGGLAADALLATHQDLETQSWQAQRAAGIDRIAVGDQTLYDHVLDWTVRLGLIPKRFRELTGLERYFAMVRGRDGLPALEMTKWFNTNDHLVPEIEVDVPPQADVGDFLAMVRRSQSVLGERAVPVVLSPVILINWSFSFTRTDISRRDQAFQIALALRQEVADLEAAGAVMVQVDEPALREGLPLKIERWQAYLSWAVDAFRLSTSVAQPETQVHTVEQRLQQLRTGGNHLPIAQTWINPDYGLKTRRWEEVVPARKNRVVATQQLRKEIQNAAD